jgi:uncharacterized protein DUF4282
MAIDTDDEELEPPGLVASLLDFSFSEFVAPRLLKLVYGMMLLLVAVVGVLAVLRTLDLMFSPYGGVFGGLLGLFFAGIGMILGIVGSRVWVEVTIALFRVAENTGELVKLGKRKPVAAAVKPPVAVKTG